MIENKNNHLEVVVYYIYNFKTLWIKAFKGTSHTISYRSRYMYVDKEKAWIYTDPHRYRPHYVLEEYLSTITREHNLRLVKQYVLCSY